MTFADLKALDHQYTMQTYGRFDVAVDHGVGATLYGLEGEEYIDFASGIGVNSVGYANPKWVEAVADQAGKLAHISNLYYSQPYANLAKELCERSGMACAFFGNSGAEANEGMIKLARKYSYDKYGEGRATVITLYKSFHGRTITTLAATGQDVFHQYFFPFTEGFRHAEAGNMDSVKEQGGDDVCAVMLELIQGEGGVNPMEQSFVQELAAYCKERDWLLLVDEVQTGIGRTGSLFCFQQYGVQPDVLSFAKGIAGGLPMGGILANEKCKSVLVAGTHATTFGGNPVSAAAALAVLEILDEKTMEEVKAKGDYIRKTVESWNAPCVTGTRGMGL
ncbi:MAG: aminotransferase class III-fold pyridoxal phosphate-dependent enzyme, partial [Oscillospiraceae bacterium]|nr:aminotransferase class III-fold pyridoxal phosphate-dependent enzyme [Oscillospiraceae bacterium]